MEAVLEKQEEKRIYMNTREVAEYLRYSPSTMERLTKRLDDPIPHIRVGRRITYIKSSVDEWIRGHEIK